MSDVAIKFENISKQYRLGTIGTGTISHDLKRWWAVNIRGKEDPYLKIGSVNERNTRLDSEYVWALRDINLEVKEGEVLGIIGKNGAGKSTLLKILSRVTSPTTGQITAKGRIASLLEVGTGFHPEMTGRENIYMNGSIMGMSKQEIRRKLDEIIDFSGVERYIDTPVKRYSSGMTVRLGFAVAAHLEPEILVVDEVLAVGDAEFQKKALGKMQDITISNGRTVLFVSHNMWAIRNICKNSIVLENGGIATISETSFAIDYYLGKSKEVKKEWKRMLPLNSTVSIIRIVALKVTGKQPNLKLPIEISIKSINPFKPCSIAFDVADENEVPIFQTIIEEELCYKYGDQVITVTINLPPLIPGRYLISAWIGSHNIETHEWLKNILLFEIEESPMKNRVIPYSKNNGFMFITSKIIKHESGT